MAQTKEYQKAWRENNKFTFKRISSRMYEGQIWSSRKRGHNPPTFTLEELRSWLNIQPNLRALMEEYKASGGKKDLKPSVDRLDDSRGYSLDNIQLGTWKDNYDNAAIEKRKAIIQLSLEGHFIKEWNSAMEIERELGINHSSISLVCKGTRATAGGFKWEHLKNK